MAPVVSISSSVVVVVVVGRRSSSSMEDPRLELEEQKMEKPILERRSLALCWKNRNS